MNTHPQQLAPRTTNASVHPTLPHRTAITQTGFQPTTQRAFVVNRCARLIPTVYYRMKRAVQLNHAYTGMVFSRMKMTYRAIVVVQSVERKPSKMIMIIMMDFWATRTFVHRIRKHVRDHHAQ